MDSVHKVVVITGASAGVGRETVRIFAENGYDVALLARGKEGLRASAREVEALGRRCLAIPTDVSDFAQVDHAAARTELELGPIDVWVNDAMTTVFSPLRDVAPEDFERALRVTFLGQVWGTKVALARMRPRDAGAIVNVGSALSFVGIPLQAAYCASKFACRGFFESTRAELLHDGSHVRLSMVHLPAMNTPQFDWCETTMEKQPQPVPPIYQPEIAARAIFDTAVDGRRSRIVGSWNKMLVVMDQLLPGVGNHFASLAAWNGQMTKNDVQVNRPSNLWTAVDSDVDYGGHGIFDKRARGMKDPSFLITLPKIAVTYIRACELTIRETIDVRKRNKARLNGDATIHVGVRGGNPQGNERIDEEGSPLSTTTTEGDNSRQQLRDVPAASKPEKNSLDVFEAENVRLLGLIEGIAVCRGSSVEERYEYGNLAKEILRHLAIRQSSLVDVSAVMSTLPNLAHLSSRIMERATELLLSIDEATKLAREVQPVALNVGQDFDGSFVPLIGAVKDEIVWELTSAIPAFREATSTEKLEGRLRTARYVRRHAPTYLNSKGPRWYEHAPVVSRLLTIYEHMNDYPRASREWRSS
ncbi:MAG TPA: SDR family oxidoreductase [Acidimicrobiales bacterium]|nr:SDR family oxidoreductase [Acidimicrobiales bacterium]